METFNYSSQIENDKVYKRSVVKSGQKDSAWDSTVAQSTSSGTRKRERTSLYSQEIRTERKVVQYELSFDQQKARELQRIKFTNPESYEEEKANFEEYLNMQLLTALGERYNRGISEFSYKSKDGKLVGMHSDEPFEDVLIRGRDYRLEYGNVLDHPRETAEVVGFQKMQELILDENTPVGSIVISVSPPGREGSIYKHNFYDMFQKQSDNSVRAVRFSSSLSATETLERLSEVVLNSEIPEEITDVALLSSPILLGNEMEMEEIHKLLHKNHDVMSEEDFNEIKRRNSELRTSLISSLINNPDDSRSHAIRFNALLNGSDDIADLLKKKKIGTIFEGKTTTYFSDKDIMSLGMRAVRGVDTGCGFSGGMAVGGLSSGFSGAFGYFGVEQFGFTRPEDDPALCKCGGDLPHFHCPGTKTVKEKDKDGNETKKKKACSYKIIVGRGTTSCPDCGESKKC